MDSAIIVAIISGLFTLIGSFGGIIASSRLTTYRIQQLEEKVNKHNRVIERVYALERHNEVQDEKIKNLDCEVKRYEN
ncbi:MAG: hypothetical protein MSR67_10555 [Oscillospiraceae bacterium]|nr:hypothetical protein [Oscillospiraceae bacterium]